MRFRGDDFEQPLEVELWPEDQGGGADVSFGRTPRHSPERRGRRPARWWIGGAAVAALVGGAIAIGQGGADESAPDSTLATIAATTTDAGPGTTRTRAVTSTTTVYAPPAALATDPGWDIYLTDGGEGLRRFDPVTGVITPAEGPSSAYAVVAGPGGPQYLWFGLLGTSGPVASVGDGTGWGIEGTDVVRVSLDDGSELERVPLAGRVIVDQTYLVGTSTLGRPVVVLADARSYEITADGAFRRFADGLVAMGVDRGRYAETKCDEAGACSSRSGAPWPPSRSRWSG